MTARVYLREAKQYKMVDITNEGKPDIDNYLEEKWQNLINILAEMMEVPAALIMKITNETMKVFLRSDNEDNPYKQGAQDALGHGLYCETVIGNNQTLLVEDALNDENWVNNPDVHLGMISYLGMPILWKDKEVFGTICILDNKANKYSDKYIKLLSLLKDAIEADLNVLEMNDKLYNLSFLDSLTEIFNRRYATLHVEKAFEDYLRYGYCFSLVMIDINKFKYINDSYGHSVGDEALRFISKIITDRVRNSDIVARYGGDEFLLLLKNTDKDQALKVVNNIKNMLNTNGQDKPYRLNIACGILEASKAFRDHNEMLKEVDKLMYLDKRH